MVWRLLSAVVLVCAIANPYSVLSHEAIIDSVWDPSLKSILLSRFPNATPADLKQAHAYAYGGAIVQDMGYYPLGSHFFSDLVHYIRSGDFIQNLISEVSDLNEFAFALGSLAHYAADHAGHSIAVNPTVALLYPKLRARFGERVLYANAPAAHLKVEFGFDVINLAKHRYAPETYHDFIGFKVSKELLDRAFEKTYALTLGETFASVDLALGTYRFSVSKVIPNMTKVAWAARKKEIEAATPGVTRQNFVYQLSRRSFEKEWDGKYERPGFFSRFVGFLFRLLPKIGPLRAFAFRLPTPEAEQLFTKSFDQTLVRYNGALSKVRAGEIPRVPNENFDTGEPVKWGTYELADETYAKLLHKLAEKKFARVDSTIRRALLDYVSEAQTIPASLKVDIAQLQEVNGTR